MKEVGGSGFDYEYPLSQIVKQLMRARKSLPSLDPRMRALPLPRLGRLSIENRDLVVVPPADAAQ